MLATVAIDNEKTGVGMVKNKYVQ
eukprot:SAG31_NODE_29765_length_390_cov_0.714777_1_plen_23_part_10